MDNEEAMIQTPADFGHFLLEKELGHGGMGGVYLARDKMLARPVAIKVMLKSLGEDPEFIERFQREAQAAARLNHPNIAQIYSFAIEDGQPYIAMELVSGGSLDKLMEQQPGQLDPVKVMRIGRQMAEALALAAESNLVHGDVKPENVLFDADGNAKLVDFGLAAMQGDSDEIWGTPYYISPEKVRRQKIDYRADIYSLGGTLYHALTGVAPFEGEDATAVVRARFDAPPRKPSEVRPDLPAGIDEIVMRMLELEPSMRYPTYQSLLGDLNKWLAAAGPERKESAPSRRIKLKSAKMRRPTTVAASEDGEEAAAPAVGTMAELAPVAEGEEEGEEKHMSIGLIVGLVAAGVVLLLGGVAGGLMWYMHAQKVAEQEEHQREIVTKQREARLAIANTREKIIHLGTNFHAKVENGMEAMKELAAGVKDALSPEMLAAIGGEFVRLDSPEIAAAEDEIAKLEAAAQAAEAAAQAAAEAEKAQKAADAAAETNKTETAAADTNKTAQAAADTNKTAQAAAPAATNAAPAKAAAPAPAPAPAKDAKAAAPAPAKDAKAAAPAPAPAAPAPAAPAAEAKPAEPAKPQVELPPALTDALKLWDDINYCRAADIRVQGRVKLLLKKADTVKQYTAEDAETTVKLAELAKALVDDLDAIKGLKAYTETLTKKLPRIPAKCKSLLKDVTSQAAKAKARAAKAAQLEAEKAARADAEAKAAESHKKFVEEELKKAQAKYDQLLGQIKHLSWDFPVKQLERLAEDAKTEEGANAAKLQAGKVQAMAALLQVFAKHAKGYTFKSGKSVSAANANEIAIKAPDVVNRKTKKTTPGKVERLRWEKFYATQPGMLKQLIWGLVEKGRARTRSPLKDWSNQMIGAALTMQTFLPKDPATDKWCEALVKKAVEEFAPCRKLAAFAFPDVELPAADDE